MLTNILNIADNCSFIDIPQCDDIKQYFDLKNASVLKVIDEYHSIEKNKISNIRNRIILLNSIQHKLSRLNNKKLNILEDYANKKRNYLNCLSEMFNSEILLPNRKIYDKEKLVSYFEGKKNNKSICLVNDTRFDYKTNTKFGEYWLEVIDPSHRSGIDFYKRVWEKEGNNTNFFMWLENNECFHNIPMIKMPSDITQYQVNINDGLIIDHNGNPKTTPNSREEIFIIDENENIYSCLSSTTIRHTSLSKGRPLLGIGSLKLEKGKIKYLENSSGHYLPEKEVLSNTIDIMRKKGINLESDIEIGYFDKESHLLKNSIYNLNQSLTFNQIFQSKKSVAR